MMNYPQWSKFLHRLDKLTDHELVSGNYLNGQDNFIRKGIKLQKKNKEYHAIKKIDITRDQMIQEYDGNNKDVYFNRSVASLLNVTPYLSANDRYELGNLFDDFIDLNRGIGEIVEYNGDEYMPIHNYKVKNKSK